MPNIVIPKKPLTSTLSAPSTVSRNLVKPDFATHTKSAIATDEEPVTFAEPMNFAEPGCQSKQIIEISQKAVSAL